MITFITPECPRCFRTSSFEITEEQWLAWEIWQKRASKYEKAKHLPGSLLSIFPTWRPAVVKQFHSGLHPTCKPPRYGGRYI